MLKTRYRTLWIVLAALTLPAMIGCADPAADAPKAVVEEAAPEAVEEVSAPEGVEYTMTSDSTIGFVGSKVTGSHDGGFESFSGTIWLVDGDPASSSFQVEIDTTSLSIDQECGVEKKKTHVRSSISSSPRRSVSSFDHALSGRCFRSSDLTSAPRPLDTGSRCATALPRRTIV